MFKVVRNAEFTHDVLVVMPVDDGFEEHKLRTRFRSKTDEELAAFDFQTRAGQDEFLRAVIVRFEDVIDETDAPLPMSDELMDQMLATPNVRVALMAHYGEARSKARLGN